MKSLRNIFASSFAVLFTLLLTASVSAQAPGFMGKRLLIGFEAPMILNHNGAIILFGTVDDYTYIIDEGSGNIYTQNNVYSRWHFIIKPAISLEYVLTRKSSIQGLFRFHQDDKDVTGIAHKGLTYYPTERAKTRFMSFGVRYKKFKKNSINPIGKYFTFGLEYVVVDYLLHDQSFQTLSFPYQHLKPEVEKIGRIVPLFGIGTQRPLSDGLLINFGLELGVPFGSANIDYSIAQSTEDWVKSNSAKHLLDAYFFNIMIGIAFLP